MEDGGDPQARHLLLPHRLQSLPRMPEVLGQLAVAVSGQLAGLPQCQRSAQQLAAVLVCALSKQTNGASSTDSGTKSLSYHEVAGIFCNRKVR
jgi:hypothetical protein